MYNSKRIRKYLSVDTTRTLIDAFIMGRVDYCDSDGGAGDTGAWGFSPPLFKRKFFLGFSMSYVRRVKIKGYL